MTADDWKRKSVYWRSAQVSTLKSTRREETDLEVLRDFTNETLEGELADEELGRLLVPTNLAEGDSSRAVTVRLLDTTGGRGRLAGGLSGELLARCLATGRLAGGLLKDSVRPRVMARSGSLASEAARELDVLGLDGDALGVDRGQVGVLEERDEVRLGGLLQRHDGRRLEAEVRLEAEQRISGVARRARATHS